jgi:hypothetical protein
LAPALVDLHNSELQKSPSRIFGQNSKNSVDISKTFSGMVIWKFESSQVSQAFWRPPRLPKKRGNGPEMAAFRGFNFVSRLPNRQTEGANWQKSPATPVNIPVLQRLRAETGFDHDCRPQAAVKFAIFSTSKAVVSGAVSRVHPPEAAQALAPVARA